jgi:hypothetical protein
VVGGKREKLEAAISLLGDELEVRVAISPSDAEPAPWAAVIESRCG